VHLGQKIEKYHSIIFLSISANKTYSFDGDLLKNFSVEKSPYPEPSPVVDFS